ncbi:toxin-activating lysine-acyltransferase [Roseovarius sp. SCSIO 43702]|uniref:toxin-activating lysine-acyltransferase n=1 Tax=Roseovarius sp. SCSIO 43702 TaxID=2823043 RepID=UPI001C733C6B|nr:toxin-activating lysine-acyltransferase [Roseovarius sp. SCSIO 43702]QYX57009.1 toxin-activating lysine-acyltransferase [Roseovarius sp. SCSIO 43702]
MIAARDSAGQPLPPSEMPSEEQLRIYGDLAFLAFRSGRHAKMGVATLRRFFEPPVLAGQFRIFRFDGVPRAAMTWAWLDEKAERKFLSGELLDPTDWQSGHRLWIIDLIAPYRGLTSQIVRWIMVRGNFAEREFRFQRMGTGNDVRRIVHIDFDADRLARVYSAERYLAAR